MIKIPAIKEISIHVPGQEAIRNRLQKIDLDNYPLAIILENMKAEEASEAAEFVYWALKNLGRDLHFPYPVFLVTDQMKTHPYFPVLSSTEKIPVHFMLREKDLTKKDIATLKKISLIRDRVKNHDFGQIRREMHELMKPQRELYAACKEIDFYQRVLKEWSRVEESPGENE